MGSQDFGINPQLGLSLAQMASPEDRAMAQAKLADLQTQVQERKNAAQRTGLENQQAQVKFSAQTAVTNMLRQKQAAGQDPTAADFIAAGGPIEGVNAAKAYNDTIKQQLDQHKQQADEMQKGVDALGNLANDMLSTPDPVQRAKKRDQGIAALHAQNGGILDPKLADQFMQTGLTDSELQTYVNQSKAAMDQSLAQRKQALEEANAKRESDFKLVAQQQKDTEIAQKKDEIALNTRKQDFEEKKPVVMAPNATLATPQGAPVYTAPAAPPTIPQPTAPMSPERFNQEKALKTQTEQAAATKAGETQDKALRKETLAIYQPALDSAERFNVMTENYKDAVEKHDQQAMLSLLANHLGMTMGLQKGARITQAVMNEAIASRPWLQGVQAKFDKDGYLSGVNLTPTQMEQMVKLGQGRFSQDLQKSKSSAKYVGTTDDGPERVPSRSTMEYYLKASGGNVNNAKAAAAADGWTIK